MKLGLIGFGNMGGALGRGALKCGAVAPESVYIHALDLTDEVADSLGVRKMRSNCEVAEAADVVILCVKPVFADAVLTEMRDSLRGKALVSIVAGLTSEKLRARLPYTRLLRVMPNTPALVGCGMAALCEENDLTADEKTFAESIFNGVGRVAWVPERLIEAVTAVSGSGPAYAFLFLEALADGGVAAGLPRKTAYELAAQTLLGSAKMLLETGKHPGELKDQVCSPGGTTIDAVAALEKSGFRGAVLNAVETCYDKAMKMAGKKA